jgi:hypothetical protein
VTRHRAITIAVLTAFAVTTAVPGSQVVAHRHEGADHDHVHAFLVGDDDHDPHHHDHDQRRQAHRHHHHAHGPALARDHHDPLAHSHVTSPFQPATATAPPTVAAASFVASDVPRPDGAPRVRHRAPAHSRGPPSALLA